MTSSSRSCLSFSESNRSLPRVRRSSTRGTGPIEAAAGGRAAERDYGGPVTYPVPLMTAQETVRRYSRCVLFLEVRKSSGDLRIGTAFHIGEGWLLTARHVIEGREITSIGWNGQKSEVAIGDVLFPQNDDADLALIRTDYPLREYPRRVEGDEHARIPTVMSDHIEIGGHLDDWLGEELILQEVVVLGYPPVPMSIAPVLVAARGEINAVVDLYSGSTHPKFVISPMARGGFSGGPVLLPWGDLLGVVTESLLPDGDTPSEMGFHAVVTVEPIWELLLHHDVFPGRNAEGAYILRSAFGRGASTFGLSEQRRQALDALVQGAQEGTPSDADPE